MEHFVNNFVNIPEAGNKYYILKADGSYEEDKLLIRTIQGLNDRAEILENKLKSTRESSAMMEERMNCYIKLVDAQKVKMAKLEAINESLEEEVDAKNYAIKHSKAIKGDVNGDGKVNFKDVLYLFMHLISPKEFPFL